MKLEYPLESVNHVRDWHQWLEWQSNKHCIETNQSDFLGLDKPKASFQIGTSVVNDDVCLVQVMITNSIASVCLKVILFLETTFQDLRVSYKNPSW